MQMIMQLEMSRALQITSFATIQVLIALVAEQLFFIGTSCEEDKCRCERIF